ncbi:uncharacterized protein si:ch211-106e7.2 [Cheilinus undulatus]|uniref:uncharacterized protein si:ch211-106e7.2 n=1 Tax=Cheilinus undulatus TaxID=241271 RepID=UPI001BD3C0E7|nr:uncharacterized protein si:ch211-106e7.2 [Cheilinus undulatus]
MDSHPWTYRQNQRAAPALQTSQALTQHFQNGTRSQQNANSPQLYRTLTNGVFPQQSSQGWSRSWRMGTLGQYGLEWNRSGNSQRIITNGSQASTQHVLPQNPPQSSSTQSQPNMMNANMAVHGMAQQNSSQSMNRRPANTSVPSFPNEHAARSNVLVPSAAHNLHRRQNSIQNGCSPPAPLPKYNTAVSQSLRNRGTISSVSVQQAVGGFSMSRVVQQNHKQLNSSRPSDSFRPSGTNVCSSYSFDDLREIAKIVEDLHKSVPAELTGGPSGNMGSSNPVMESNLNVQSAENNSCTLQSSALSSQWSLSKTTNISTQQTQQSNNAPRQHSSVPNVYLRAAGDGVTDGRTASNAFFPTNTQGSSGNQGQTLSTESQLTTQHSRAERFIMEMLRSSKSGALHSSPGRTRAVAVVPPLSQDAAQHASSNVTNSAGVMTDESVSDSQKNDNINKAKEFRNKSFLVPENPNPVASDKSKISGSSPSNNHSASLSDSMRHQDLSLKHLGTDNTRAEQAVSTQAVGHIPPNAPEAAGSESAASQHKEPADLETGFLELSKIQTIDCRSSELEKIVRFFEEKQAAQSTSSKMSDPGVSIVMHLWDGNYEKCETLRKSDWYEKLTLNAKTFCDQHVTEDTVIASRAKKVHAAFLKQHHILTHNNVYTEPPYKSSWLNLNEQLDDIDKEFGLP